MDIYSQLKKYTDFSLGKSSVKCELLYQNISLNDITFTGYDLNNSKFLEVRFHHCDFSNVYLSGASLCGSDFINCKFKKNIFRKGFCDYTRFKSTTFDLLDSFRTSYYEALFTDIQFQNTKMERSYFDDSEFINTKFINTKLIESSFDNCKFKGVKFVNCDFYKTSFKNVRDLDSIFFENVTLVLDDQIISNLGNEIKSYL